MIKKNLKEWEDCLPHVEFAYNRAVHSTTQMCPFEVMYGFKPITPFDLLPLPLHERANMEASKRADYVKKIHMKTKQKIERKSKDYATKANKNHKKMIFEPSDFVWVHLRKDGFLEKQKSKLLPRGDGPFKVLARINDNAYKIELPGDKYAASDTFNVPNLSPTHGHEQSESRSTLFEEGEDDEYVSHGFPLKNIEQDPQAHNYTYERPMTRAKVKQLQHEVNPFLNDYEHASPKNHVLPNGDTLLVLRFESQVKGGLNTWHQREQVGVEKLMHRF
jgi:hypothetical protein